MFANDTVSSDPLYSVPLSFDSEDFQALPMTEGVRDTTPHLCFEIHGNPESYFNLVSDACVSVNALYTAVTVTNPGSYGTNVITKVGITAVDSTGGCAFIEIGVGNGCLPIVRSQDLNGDGELDPVEMAEYNLNGISVSKRRTHVRVSVPNCGSVRLVMYTSCESSEESNTTMLRFDITRGTNLLPTSHGLMGRLIIVYSVVVVLHIILHDGLKYMVTTRNFCS